MPINSYVKTLRTLCARYYLKAIITHNVILHENLTSTFFQYINEFLNNHNNDIAKIKK